jgi:hypothetical protein
MALSSFNSPQWKQVDAKSIFLGVDATKFIKKIFEQICAICSFILMTKRNAKTDLC